MKNIKDDKAEYDAEVEKVLAQADADFVKHRELRKSALAAIAKVAGLTDEELEALQ